MSVPLIMFWCTAQASQYFPQKARLIHCYTKTVRISSLLGKSRLAPPQREFLLGLNTTISSPFNGGGSCDNHR